MALSQKTTDRIKLAIKRFQPILQSAKSRDVNESDTVTIITDMLEQLFGYDKYSEITSEHVIRGTYCDLAVRMEDKIILLIEVKAIGLSLKDSHIKQAIDYAANQGTEWVVLTNGEEWNIYKVKFSKPIDHELVLNFNMLNISSKAADDIENLSTLCKEGLKRNKLEELYTTKEAINKFTIGAVLQTDAVVSVIRRELKRLSKDIKFGEDEILKLLKDEVIKRDVFEGEMAINAQKKIAKFERKQAKIQQAPTNEIEFYDIKAQVN